MKRVMGVGVVLLLFVGATAHAGSFDGTYKFVSRTKNGTPDMSGWWGMMVITNDTMSRVYHDQSGKTEKYYVGTLKPEKELYTVTFTQAYKPEYVGNVHKQKLMVNGNTFTIESDDGSFKEVWTKK